MSNKVFIIFGIAAGMISGLIIGLLVFNYLQQKSSNNKHVNVGIISGTVDLNGEVTADSYITILARDGDKISFDIIVDKLEAKDTTTWAWHNAEDNKIYEIKAVLYVDGNKNSESNPIVVTAPAVDEKLVINSKYQPAAAVTPAAAATISGGIDLNGAIGPKSFISVFAKEITEPNFKLLMNNVLASDGSQWSWNQAKTGKQYQLKATLYVNGSYAGDSQIIVVTAPANNEILRINSTYRLVNVKSSITGSINVNGAIPDQSTLTVYKKAVNENSYFPVVQGIRAVDGLAWRFDDAVAGVEYNIKAVIFNNNNSIGESQIIDVTAPAGNEIFNFNLNSKMSQPPSVVTVSCNGQVSDYWKLVLSYPSISNVSQYWIRIGRQPGWNDIGEYRLPSSNQNPQIYNINDNSNIKNGQSYYVDYAYSNCGSCNYINAFSQFSRTLQFSCPLLQPTPTSGPAPTLTPAPTSPPQPTPTSSPQPTATPKIAQCNESCGADGYQCTSGLDCITDPALIGSGVCRNPNCQDETSCVCPPQ